MMSDDRNISRKYLVSLFPFMIYIGKSGIKILLKKPSVEIHNMVSDKKHRCEPIILQDMLCKSYFKHNSHSCTELKMNAGYVNPRYLLNIFTKLKKQASDSSIKALQKKGEVISKGNLDYELLCVRKVQG